MSAPLLSSLSVAARAGVVFLIAFVLAAGLTAIAVRVCKKRGWVSKPRPDRWHAGTPAFFGGVPIYAGFLSVSAFLVPTSNPRIWTIVSLSSLVFLLGFLDDIFHLAPGRKLLGQLAIAVVALNGGLVYLASNSPLLNVAASLLWIVGITNAFNLLDNMDGLCAGTAILAALYFLMFCLVDGAHGYVIVISVLAGSMAGFLLFNFHPARIFMGDSGSLFLGFFLATTSLEQTARSLDVFTPVILLAVPILDTLLVSVSRRLRGQPVSQGGTDHTSHRLVRLGMKERSAVLLLYAITACSGSLALAARLLAHSRSLVVMTLWFVLLLMLGVQLFKPRSGVRVEPTAQAVGLSPVVNPPRGGRYSRSSGWPI